MIRKRFRRSETWSPILFVFNLKGEKMIDFVVKLEEILKNSGNEDWGIKYVPEKDGYLLRLDKDFILMTKVESDRY